MQVIRTPDERFANLVDYAFEPRYAQVSADPISRSGSLRVHYLDEGPRSADPILLMHGEPSWCYLYRHMIPGLVAAGHRVIAPDLVGFGRSDKPTQHDDYTYARHVGWMSELLLEHLDIRNATFFGQDWGGLVGLRVVAAAPERFARVLISNTGLPDADRPPTEAFLNWQRFSRESPVFPIGAIIDGGTTRSLSAAEIAAYDAPFPSDEYTAGARIFPSLVPTSADDPAVADNRGAWDVLERFERPWLCAFTDRDPVTAGGERPFIRRIPGAHGQPHRTISGGGHFVQEDAPDELVRLLLGLIDGTLES